MLQKEIAFDEILCRIQSILRQINTSASRTISMNLDSLSYTGRPHFDNRLSLLKRIDAANQWLGSNQLTEAQQMLLADEKDCMNALVSTPAQT